MKHAVQIAKAGKNIGVTQLDWDPSKKKYFRPSRRASSFFTLRTPGDAANFLAAIQAGIDGTLRRD